MGGEPVPRVKRARRSPGHRGAGRALGRGRATACTYRECVAWHSSTASSATTSGGKAQSPGRRLRMHRLHLGRPPRRPVQTGAALTDDAVTLADCVLFLAAITRIAWGQPHGVTLSHSPLLQAQYRMGAPTTHSFSAAVHFRRCPFWLMVGPPGSRDFTTPGGGCHLR
jgi:hypothetical protein